MPDSVTDADARALIAAYPRWYRRIEVRPGVITPGINDSPLQLQMLQLPADCSGMRVLDIGARDGFFSFELERRGAEVLAVDYMPAERTGFPIAARLLGSARRLSAGEHLRSHARGDGHVQSGALSRIALPPARSDPGDSYRAPPLQFRGCTWKPSSSTRPWPMPDRSEASLASLDERLTGDPVDAVLPRAPRSNGNPTNYWGPNVRCVEAMLGESEFRVERVARVPRRAVFECAVVSNPKTAYYLNASDSCTNIAVTLSIPGLVTGLAFSAAGLAAMLSCLLLPSGPDDLNRQHETCAAHVRKPHHQLLDKLNRELVLAGRDRRARAHLELHRVAGRHGPRQVGALGSEPPSLRVVRADPGCSGGRHSRRLSAPGWRPPCRATRHRRHCVDVTLDRDNLVGFDGSWGIRARPTGPAWHSPEVVSPWRRRRWEAAGRRPGWAARGVSASGNGDSGEQRQQNRRRIVI